MDIFDKYTVSFDKGEKVFEEGDLGTEMYIIKSGRVRVEKDIGGETKELAVFGKGDFFGEMSLLENEPRSATIVCLEDCKLVKINKAMFDEMIRKNIEIAVRMLRKFSARVRESNRMVEKLLDESKTVRDRDQILELEEESDEEERREPDMDEADAFIESEESGKRYPVSGEDILIGRADPVTGIEPEIDLGEEKNARKLSRRHARLMFQDGEFYIAEEVGALNGTFVDGKKAKPGEPLKLEDGSRVTLGMTSLTFHTV